MSLTKEEVGYLPTHKIVKMVLLSPHEADHLYKKEDGTFYWCHHRKSGDTFSIPEIQLEMFPPEPPKPIKIPQEVLDRAPHHNILELSEDQT